MSWRFEDFAEGATSLFNRCNTHSPVSIEDLSRESLTRNIDLHDDEISFWSRSYTYYSMDSHTS